MCDLCSQGFEVIGLEGGPALRALFELGADDYVAKPANLRELLARVPLTCALPVCGEK